MSKINFENYLSAMEDLHKQEKSFVVITLVHHRGSSPQEVGARAIVSKDGLEFGTVGGGKVENRAIQEAQKMLNEGTPYLFADWNLQKDIGMTCGGVVSYFFELFEYSHPFQIAVFGAGHIAQELVPLLLKLDCKVLCADSRQEWLDKLPSSPRLKKICQENLADLVKGLPDKTYITLMTMGHGSDLPVLIEVMKQRERFSYVGNVGSEQKAKRLRKDLLDAGIPEEKLTQFFCPVGEDFGHNAPITIAFSIIAQILKLRKPSPT